MGYLSRSERGVEQLVRGAAPVLLAALLLLGCKFDEVLKVEHPGIVIEPPATPGAAIALKNGVFRRLSSAVAGTQSPDALFAFGGLITDEWRSGDTFVQRNNQDQRIFDPANTFNAGPYRNLNRVRVQAKIAIDAIRDLVPDSVAAVGTMFGMVAYVETLIGEHYCNGTPLSEPDPVTPGVINYGKPLTNDSVMGLAVAQADSGLAAADFLRRLADSLLLHADTALARGDTALARRDSALARQRTTESDKVRWLSSVVKGRSLVNRGRFAEAAAAVAGVADTFKFQVTYSTAIDFDNQLWALNNNARRYTLVNREGGVGLDYVSAADPRLPTRTGGSGTSGRIFDTQSPISVIRQGIWGRESPVTIVSGIEARLIEAEAALQPGGDPNAWLNIINALRTNSALYPPREAEETEPPNWVPARGTVLAPLAQPASDSLRIDSHFRERAFWMFSTGHRLGDLRRLVRQYGRLADGTFPTGAYYKGGSFGAAVNMSVPFQETNNPEFQQCLDLNP